MPLNTTYDYYYNQRNTSNQLNPNNDAFWKCRGYNSRPENWKGKKKSVILYFVMYYYIICKFYKQVHCFKFCVKKKLKIQHKVLDNGKNILQFKFVAQVFQIMICYLDCITGMLPPSRMIFLFIFIYLSSVILCLLQCVVFHKKIMQDFLKNTSF